MTLHFRQLVRNYICNKLNNSTNAADKVFNTKITPNRGPFPVIGVYTLSDIKSDEVCLSPYQQLRNIALEIQVEVQANATWQDDLDAICWQIENLIDTKLGGGLDQLKWCKLKDTSITGSDNPETLTAIATMSWDIEYFWSEALVDPSTLDNLDWIYTSYDMAYPNNGTTDGPDGVIDAIDHIGNLST